MIQLTVRELLQGKYDQRINLEGVYLVRDSECILYVGRSFCMVGRLHEHIEKWTSSPLGDVIRINAPLSLNWQIELREPEECRAFVALKYPLFQNSVRTISVELAERSMIMHYHPCLNTANNPEPCRLPEHIKRYPVELEVGLTDNLY